MKHFRRKRTTSTTSPSPANPLSISVSNPGPPAPTSQPDTPLYARFTHRSPDGAGSKPVVSGPIALAPRRGGQGPVNVAAAGPPSRGSSPQKELTREEGKSVPRRDDSVMEERMVRRPGEDELRGRRDLEVKRMPSNGEGLLGRSGERVEGERVLLPARKRTVKRAGDEEDVEEARSRDVAEGRPERPKTETLPLRGRVLDEPLSSPDDHAPLPPRKPTQRRAEEVFTERARETPRGEVSPVTESEPGEGVSGAERPRVKGPRVISPPPRTVSRRKVVVEGDANAASTSRRKLEDSRAREALQESSFTSSPVVAFNSESTHHGSASTRAVVIGSPSHSDGWEDKFSTSKWMHGNTIATSPSTSPSSGKPLRPLPDPFNSSNRPTDTQKSTTSSSNVPSATAAIQESSSSGSTSRDWEDRPRIVGDRVLLPARKVTLRHAENSSESDAPPERGRTLNTRRHTRLSRDIGSDISVATSSGPFVASAVSPPSSNLSCHPDGNRAILDDDRLLPEVIAPPLARPDESSLKPPTRSASNAEPTTIGPTADSKSVFPGGRPSLDRIKSSEDSAASNVSSGSGATVAASNVTSKTSSSTETSERPPRRRKYSLLAAFGLPRSRTTSESETSTGPTMQSTKVWKNLILDGWCLLSWSLCLVTPLVVVLGDGRGSALASCATIARWRPCRCASDWSRRCSRSRSCSFHLSCSSPRLTHVLHRHVGASRTGDRAAS
ncbi:hypothetical protein GSI_10606 [Ganoderma sinense ZZ0214-1]|uniref:Uncharacterized protein n=1 Tax=Ganoderma sinense ZZ0214-1 TaxID=1077348 RepID=A0A2G8S139_9APHY|nr:hypothetical protein GSI_10606 [Ganoderma sinense ZZ0214-1]